MVASAKACLTGADNCPCGSKLAFSDCCGPIISGTQPAATAERLMRSRYTAFTLGAQEYLLASWHPDTRPSRVSLDPRQRWLGLSIKATEQGGPEDQAGVVEFVARFKVDGRGHRLHEISRFRRVEGSWHYLDGEHLAT